jgi:hypothetical protein
LSPAARARTTRPWRRSACSRSAKISSVSIVSMSRERVDAPLGVDDVVVVVRADDVDDRVGLADVRQELVAEALALVRAATSPAMSWNWIVSWTRFDAPIVSATRSRRSSSTGHDRDVRLDRRERVVRRLGARPSSAR